MYFPGSSIICIFQEALSYVFDRVLKTHLYLRCQLPVFITVMNFLNINMLFLAMSILLILGKENKACSLEEEPKELTVSPN